MTTNTQTAAASQTPIDFPVWKTIKNPYYSVTDPEGRWIAHEGHNMLEAEIDLIKISSDDLGLGVKPDFVTLERAARKGKALGLTFVPDFILKELGELLVAESGKNPNRYPLVYAMANDFGQVFPFEFGDGGGEFSIINTHGVLVLQCGLSPQAPLIFVKPRKGERQ